MSARPAYVLKKLDKSHAKLFNEFRAEIGLRKKAASVFDDPGYGSWLIVHSRSKKSIGWIQILRDEDGSHEIGFVMLPKFRGQGVLSRILPGFVRDLGLPLYAETAVGNTSAMRVLEKSGFKSCAPKNPTHRTAYGEILPSAGFRFKP